MTKELKLKGTNSKKISKEKKKKMKETLERMQETRKQDEVKLRTTIEKKLFWAKSLKVITTKELKTLSQQYKTKQSILMQLNVIIPAFEELLGIPEKDTKENKLWSNATLV